jgi:phytanoyl-CoA hydroxylase
MLTSEQVEAYHTHGYITVAGVLSAQEIEELRCVTEEFVDRSRNATDHTDEFDLEPGHTAATPRLRRLKYPEALHPAYDRVMRHQAIVDMVAQLVGPNVRHFGGKLNMKAAGFGSPVEWHQDFAFAARTNDDMLAVGVPLDDMTEENGCLLVVPRSHKGPIYNHFQGDVFVGGITDPDFDPGDVVPLELAAGDISIHHGRSLHASAPNTSPDKPRRLYLLQMCAADAWLVAAAEDPSERDLDENMLRGEAPAEPRWVEAPPMPTPDHIKPGLSGSIYESQKLLERRFFKQS